MAHAGARARREHEQPLGVLRQPEQPVAVSDRMGARPGSRHGPGSASSVATKSKIAPATSSIIDCARSLPLPGSGWKR